MIERRKKQVFYPGLNKRRESDGKNPNRREDPLLFPPIMDYFSEVTSQTYGDY